MIRLGLSICLDEVRISRNAKTLYYDKGSKHDLNAETFSLNLLNCKGNEVAINGQTFSRQEIEAGIPLKFKALETGIIHVKE